jgi:hypothetical protein
MRAGPIAARSAASTRRGSRVQRRHPHDPPDSGRERQARAVLGVGGAIVADSDPMAEWRECLIKGGFVRGKRRRLRPDRDDALRPEEGMPLLELHLERIKASAAELGFTFDRHDARNRIQALCFELEAPAKVRLLLARSGAIALETAPLARTPEGPVPCIALPLPVVPGDWRLRHKTTDRSFYERRWRWRSSAARRGAAGARGRAGDRRQHFQPVRRARRQAADAAGSRSACCPACCAAS